MRSLFFLCCFRFFLLVLCVRGVVVVAVGLVGSLADAKRTVWYIQVRRSTLDSDELDDHFANTEDISKKDGWVAGFPLAVHPLRVNVLCLASFTARSYTVLLC